MSFPCIHHSSNKMSYHPLYLLSCGILYLSLTQLAKCSTSDMSVDLKTLPLACQMQCDQGIANTKTENYCLKQSGRVISGRCCVISKDSTIVGIDLRKCRLDKHKLSTAFKNMTELMYIALEGNDIAQVTSEDFHRNTHIAYLSLPQGLLCPGSESAWNETSNSTGVTECFLGLDMCKVDNVTCPEHSHCVPSGVDQFECLCDDGYHGYKCMNQGTFPVLAFVLGITIPTIVLSALLWITQRRYVKASNKNK